MSLTKLIQTCIREFETPALTRASVSGDTAPGTIYDAVSSTIVRLVTSDIQLMKYLSRAMIMGLRPGDQDIDLGSLPGAQRSLLISSVTEHICEKYPLLALESERRELTHFASA